MIAKKIHREPFLEVGMDLYPLVGATLGVSAARAEIPYTETLSDYDVENGALPRLTAAELCYTETA